MGAAHKLLISFSVTSTRRPNAGAQGGEIPLPRATLRSREREGKGCAAGLTSGAVKPAVALRSVVGEDRLHARETSCGGGAHKRQGQDHERTDNICQHARNTALDKPALEVRGNVAPNTPQQDAHTDDAWDIEQ